MAVELIKGIEITAFIKLVFNSATYVHIYDIVFKAKEEGEFIAKMIFRLYFTDWTSNNTKKMCSIFQTPRVRLGLPNR